MNHKSNMNVGGESHGRVVPAKCPNKDGKPSAEGAEGRRPTKENTEQTTASQIQCWGNALSGLSRVREAARRDKRLRFTALLHHVSEPCIYAGFRYLLAVSPIASEIASAIAGLGHSTPATPGTLREANEVQAASRGSSRSCATLP